MKRNITNRLLHTFLWGCILLLGACQSSHTATDIVLDFEVSSPTSSKVVIVYNANVLQTELDAEGHGRCTLQGLDAVYATLFYGEQSREIYAERGDRLLLTFDGHNFEKTFKASGKHDAICNYLNTNTLTMIPDDSYKLDFNMFCQEIEQTEQEALKLLKARKMDDIGSFMPREEARIHYNYGCALLLYPLGHAMMTSDSAYTPTPDYYDKLKTYWTDNALYADISDYRAFMAEAAWALGDADKQHYDLYQRTLTQLRYLIDHLAPGRNLQLLVNDLTCAYIDQKGIENISELSNIYHAYVSDSLLIETYQQHYDRYDVTAVGKPSPALVAPDADGILHTLDEFKGKYVYIDIWATWCAPCQEELPELKALAEKLSDKNIAFVGLSVDRNRSAWAARVASGHLPGTQLLLGEESEFLDAYHVEGIPRFILLDREGCIVNSQMTRPSQPDTERILLALEGI